MKAGGALVTFGGGCRAHAERRGRTMPIAVAFLADNCTKQVRLHKQGWSESTFSVLGGKDCDFSLSKMPQPGA
jgi:hypothetical protein